MVTMRKWAFVFLCSPLLTIACDAAPKRSAQTTSPNGQATTPAPQVDCTSLTADEQQFAYGLTAENRAMFCGKFTDVQRAAAMQLTSQPDPTGALLSPDQAVARVAAANNITPQKKSTGGCPVK